MFWSKPRTFLADVVIEIALSGGGRQANRIIASCSLGDSFDLIGFLCASLHHSAGIYLGSLRVPILTKGKPICGA